MKISELAEKAGVTIRTLRYYDKIGLLSPEERTKAGYRVYGETSLSRLQQILFFRELEFPLEEIKAILDAPDYDRTDALRGHRALLLKKRERLNRLLTLVESAIKGEHTMDLMPFDNSDYETARQRYAEEVKARWGHTEAYKESQAKMPTGTAQEETEAVFRAFAACRGMGAKSPEVQALVSRWQDTITRHYYTCTKEILAGLGQMYTADARFKANLDRYGEGTAELMAEAIQIYCT